MFTSKSKWSKWPKWSSAVERGLWLLTAAILAHHFQTTESLIVPEELPTILSVIYSNIPPIKKGTDSRIGLGFRLGPHADFQVIFELGPQKDTQPIGGVGSNDNNSVAKRQTGGAAQQNERDAAATLAGAGPNWLENWAKQLWDMNETKKPTKPTKKKRKITSQMMPPAQPQVEANALRQLQSLYKMAATATATAMAKSAPAASAGLALPVPLREQDTNTLSSANGRKKSKGEITSELMDVSLEDAASAS